MARRWRLVALIQKCASICGLTDNTAKKRYSDDDSVALFYFFMPYLFIVSNFKALPSPPSRLSISLLNQSLQSKSYRFASSWYLFKIPLTICCCSLIYFNNGNLIHSFFYSIFGLLWIMSHQKWMIVFTGFNGLKNCQCRKGDFRNARLYSSQ